MVACSRPSTTSALRSTEKSVLLSEVKLCIASSSSYSLSQPLWEETARFSSTLSGALAGPFTNPAMRNSMLLVLPMPSSVSRIRVMSRSVLSSVKISVKSSSTLLVSSMVQSMEASR